MSRTKGARAERELCKILGAWGYDAVRTPLSGGSHWKGDVHSPDGGPAIPGHHIEVKMQERLALPAWLKQCESDCQVGDVPVLAFRQSRQPWRVVIPLDYFLSLLASDEDASLDAVKLQRGERT